MEILTNEELLKDKLNPCRELCPILLDIFFWKKEYYPYALAGFVTFVFGTLWYLDPSVITAVSILGLIITLADFFLPSISKSILSEERWSSEKDKKFSIFVNRIAYFSVQVWNFRIQLDEWKKERPNQYAAITVVALLTLAWIGNAVNNLFLVYLIFLFASLLPGLLHRRILQKFIGYFALTVGNALGIKRKSK